MKRPRLLKDNECVKVVPYSHDLGRHELMLCPIWRPTKNGRRIFRFFIDPIQESKDRGGTYVVECRSETFSVESWHAGEIAQARPWVHFWCAEHKAMGMRVYIPEGADCFHIMSLPSACGIRFSRQDAT